MEHIANVFLSQSQQTSNKIYFFIRKSEEKQEANSETKSLFK